MNNFNTINNKINLENFLIISWIICLLSIGVTQENPFLINYPEKEKNIIYYSNLLRYLSPSILLPILIYIFFKLKNKPNVFICVFFFYGLWQLIIFIFLKKNLEILQNWQLIFNLFSTLLIFQLAICCDKNFHKKLLYIFIFFIFIILFYFSCKLLFDYINDDKLLYLYHSKVLHPNTTMFEQEVPRVTGLTRMAVIIFYLFFFYKEDCKKKILIVSCTIFLGFLFILIYALNTRTGIIGIAILVLFYIFFIKKKIIKKVLNIFLIIIIPIIIFETIVYNKNYIENAQIENNRLLDNPSSSGRTEIWNNSLQILKDNKIIFGAGPQADRFLIDEYLKKNKLNKNFIVYENNVSNAILYSYLCGGIISLTLLCIIYFLILKGIFINLFLSNAKNMKNTTANFSITTLLFIMTRSFFENGFALFGIDFCLCCLSYFMLIKSNNFVKKYQ